MKIVILGGGLTGLTAAEELSRDNDVLVLEKQDFLGGLASSFIHEGKRIPKHYHHVFHHDYLTRGCLDRFGLMDDVFWKKIKMGICVNKKKYNFTDPLSLLKFDYLSFWGRIRYGLFGAYVLFLMSPKRIKDDMDAEKWLKKYAGYEVTKKLFYHLYARNKFNIPLRRISAKQLAFRLKAGEALGKFCYPKKGLDLMIEGIAKSVLRRGGEIKINFDIKEIDLKNKLINENIKYDILINTIPVPEFLKVARDVPKSYKQRVSKVKYCPCVSVVFGTKGFLSEHYWLNIFDERIHMLMQHSNLYDGYDEKINWCLRYGGSGEDLKLSDEKIKKEYLSVVKKYFPECEIVWSKVFREKYAEPVYDKDYFDYNPGYKTPMDGVYNAGIAVTYPKIRNMNTVFESGLKVAEMIREDFRIS